METPKSSPNKRIYPKIHAEIPNNPNRLFALPLIGYIIKSICLIPANIVFGFFCLISFAAFVINSFVILFSGKYWNFAYRIATGTMQYQTRIHFFLYGITDTYPGFSLYKKSGIAIDIPKPEKPNRFLSFPLFGFLIRVILLIPFLIYSHIIALSTTFALIGSILFVFFRRFYPESCFEIIKDSQRLTLASGSYILGLSDTYPSFKISMNHKGVKIFFIVTGVILLLLSGNGRSKTGKNSMSPNYHRTYQMIKH